MTPVSPPGRSSRALAAAALMGAIIVVAVLVLSSGGDDHRVTLTMDTSAHTIKGIDVVAAGQKVGSVSEAETTSDNRAHVELRVNDDVWPLPRGTKVRLRFAGTVKYTARYFELDPPAKGPPLADGAAIPTSDVVVPEDYSTTPSEFDDVFGTFDAATRRDLRSMLDAGGAAVGPAADPLRRTLDTAPPVVLEASGLMKDLGGDPEALDTLVRSTDGLVDAIDSSNPDVGRLVTGAATTFEAVASESQELERALAELPGTLSTTRRTLGHADTTLRAAGDLTGRLAPGVGEVRKLARPLASVLGTVVDVGPDARQTLSSLRRATPDLNPMLTRARTLMPTIESIGRQGAKQLNCIRPYAPEVAGLGGTWAGLWGTTDGKDHYVRAEVGAVPFPTGTPLNAGEIHRLLPQVRSVLPRPPGELVDQPWFIPECGYTPDALDSSKDSESLRIDALERPIVEIKDNG